MSGQHQPQQYGVSGHGGQQGYQSPTQQPQYSGPSSGYSHQQPQFPGPPSGYSQQAPPIQHSSYAQQQQQQMRETYGQPSRYQDNYGQSGYDRSYAGSRDGQIASAQQAGSKPKSNIWSFDFVKSAWSRNFFIIVAIQAVLCLAFEAYIFAKFQTSLGTYLADNAKADAQYKTIPVFLTLFIFGFLYELVLVWDALRMKNTIQIIGVCISNLALLVYTAIQVDQISEAIEILQGLGGLKEGMTKETIWGDIQGFLIAIPCIIAATTVAMSFAAWKLYQEFAWDILKHIGADYRMKKRFLHYQIYIALLKFDFFFFLGFMVQFLVVVNNQPDDFEFGLTIAVIPITIVILLAAAFFTRRENKWGMMFIILCYLVALTYFIFKLVRIYQPRTAPLYLPVRKSLTAFSVITILLILLTISNAVICMNNFGAGLKNYLGTRRTGREEEKQDLQSINLNELKQPQVPSRMTID